MIAFGFRALFILAIPNLSQDFYRFIWDGRMIWEGFNPYLYTPEAFINTGHFPVSQAQELYIGMGTLNGSHFTNYPPINQLCFMIAGLFAGKSILGSAVALRLLIIAADFGTLHFGRKVLKQFQIPEKRIFWYILNPFIIIELTGNLHFEGVMIFFMVWSLYLLQKGLWKWAALTFALSISVKLMPLLFLPLFFQYFRKPNDLVDSKRTTRIDFKALLKFYMIVGLTTLLLFLPFFSNDFITNYTETVALWFNNFEFNASVYYLIREIGYWITGYNEIEVIGKTLAFIIFSYVVCLALFRIPLHTKSLVSNMLLVFSVYLFLSTTVHPWYIATLLILGVFSNYKYPLVWSFVVILSYLAYIHVDRADKSENLWIIAIEYLVVFSVFIWEIFLSPKKKKTIRKVSFRMK